jgi:solute carrier family 31 (copper transporter), member 1
MLWNWYTVDSCFISATWHVTSSGMFAGSCIGTILLVMLLEFLRRTVKEYDRFLIRQHEHSAAAVANSAASVNKSADTSPQRPVKAASLATTGFRPTVLQQATRALLHMVQFAVAYFIML